MRWSQFRFDRSEVIYASLIRSDQPAVRLLALAEHKEKSRAAWKGNQICLKHFAKLEVDALRKLGYS
jgi:hypothetical protein